MYRGKEKLINPYKKEYLSSSFDESYKSVYVRLLNLIVGSAITIKASSTRYASPKSTTPTFRAANQDLHKNWIDNSATLWSNLAIDISFGSFFNNPNGLTYELYLVQYNDPLLGNKSYELPKHCYDTVVTAPSTVDDKPEFKEQSLRNGNMDASFKQFHIWVRVPKYLQVKHQLAANNIVKQEYEGNKVYLNKYSYIAILCKYSDAQIQLPLHPKDKQGYLWNIMPLIKDNKKEEEYITFRNVKAGKATIIEDKSLFFRRFPLQH